jgi:hypothetical protein
MSDHHLLIFRHPKTDYIEALAGSHDIASGQTVQKTHPLFLYPTAEIICCITAHCMVTA